MQAVGRGRRAGTQCKEQRSAWWVLLTSWPPKSSQAVMIQHPQAFCSPAHTYNLQAAGPPGQLLEQLQVVAALLGAAPGLQALPRLVRAQRGASGMQCLSPAARWLPVTRRLWSRQQLPARRPRSALAPLPPHRPLWSAQRVGGALAPLPPRGGHPLRWCWRCRLLLGCWLQQSALQVSLAWMSCQVRAPAPLGRRRLRHWRQHVLAKAGWSLRR